MLVAPFKVSSAFASIQLPITSPALKRVALSLLEASVLVKPKEAAKSSPLLMVPDKVSAKLGRSLDKATACSKVMGTIITNMTTTGSKTNRYDIGIAAHNNL